ncbi:hypothetical protein BDN72DRAFT_959371 [Pluteus cervinus]|uniref:Uncharacterized protein n=1 Tax=Pluteus cervinus TaxID=181527 RepID=A0ACD3AWF9_9AGAR|nr:hypothetical protein BDN72DRAFT_959371 [Pluteus cervinus]
MPSLGQFSAHITVNNVPLPEYGVDLDENKRTVSCWIPSAEDQEFAVRWKDSDNKFDLSGHVWVDGISVGGKSSQHRPRHRVLESSKQFVRTSSTSGRPLVFSKVELTEDDEYLNSSISSQLGEVRLTISHVKISGYHPYSGKQSTLPDAVKLHERTKKAIGHCVVTGDETMYRKHARVKSAKIRQVVTFIFKYRPLAFLQAEGVAPLFIRSLNAAASTSRSNNASVSNSRDRNDAATLDRSRAPVGHGLRSLEGTVERPAPQIKSEVKPEPRPSVIKHLGTIDLTMDD